MYSLGLYLYAIGAVIASIFNPKIRKIIAGIGHSYRTLRREIKKNDRVVWFHAASLGEFEQGRPLMERLRRNHPEYKILLTFFSPSGYEVRKNYEGADVICYMPFDTPGNAASFLRLAHPEIAIFIKYEFWQNYLTTMRRRGIRSYSVSSIFRPQQHFFRWWGSAKALRQFDHLFVQNEQSRQLLSSVGIQNVTIVGDTRFDRVIDIRNTASPLPLVQKFVGTSPAFVAGSSWEPDEAIYIPYFAEHKDWKLIIAPHVIGESHLQHIEQLLKAHGRTSVRYTELEEGKGNAEADTLIVNCFGKLSSIYRYGRIALVGGGFGAGIHNVPEAAVYGIPVVFGPNNKKFREAQALLECGGSFEYSDTTTFATIMNRFLADNKALAHSGEQAQAYIYDNSGAADACYKAIFEQR